MLTESLRSTSSLATEQEFFAWRDSFPAFREHLGPDKPLVNPVASQEITDILTGGSLAELDPTATTLLDSFRMRKRLNHLLRDDIKEIWNDLDDMERVRVQENAYAMDTGDPFDIDEPENEIAYQAMYLAPLIRHCFAVHPEKTREFFRKNAGRITGEYARLHAQGAAETGILIKQASQRVIDALQAGKIRHVRAEWGTERIKRLQFVIQDPHMFKKTWANTYEGSIEATAYYNPDTHTVVLPSSLGEMRHQVAEGIVVHEDLHALSAISYARIGDDIKSKRSGLFRYTLTDCMDTGSRRSTHTILNEFEIESQARILMELAPDSKSGMYSGWRQVGWAVIKLAGKLRPGSNYEDTLMAAVFEQPQVDESSPKRWPATKALGQETAEIFGPGFLNRLDCFVAAHGTARALRLLTEKDWHKIRFEKSSNHLRHNPPEKQ